MVMPEREQIVLRRQQRLVPVLLADRKGVTDGRFRARAAAFHHQAGALLQHPLGSPLGVPLDAAVGRIRASSPVDPRPG